MQKIKRVLFQYIKMKPPPQCAESRRQHRRMCDNSDSYQNLSGLYVYCNFKVNVRYFETIWFCDIHRSTPAAVLRYALRT